MVWPAAGAGPAKLALADQELDSTRLAPCRRHGAADPKGFAHCRRPLFWRDWWLVDWYTLKMILSPGPSFFTIVIILGPWWHLFRTCGHHFGIILASFWDLWASFWDHWAPLWDTWATSCCMGGPCIEINEFPARFWTLWGSPFSPLGVTILFPRVWNGGNSVFCGQPDSRLDFGMKSDEFLECLGW